MNLVETALAIALASEAEHRVDADERTPAADMLAELDQEMAEVWLKRHRIEYWRTGRRRGKSHYLIRRALEAAQSEPTSINPYILPTAKSARLVIWPLVKRLTAKHYPDAKLDETLMTVTMPAGGVLVVGGCECTAHVGRWFGMPFRRATIDECGNFPDAVLRLLIDEAIEPSLLDFGGDLVLSGNPGLVLQGYWFECTGPRRIDQTPLYTGDARNNPHLKQDPTAYFESVKQRHGWTDASPTFQRQYLGEWVEDEGALVFPLVHGRNTGLGEALPGKSANGGALPPATWRFVIGVDVGVVDATAIAVVGAHPLDNREYVVSTEKHERWITGQLAERLRELRKTYPNAPIVLDTGGMGKLHAEELSRRFAINVQAAEKREKESAIRTTRDLLIAGRVIVLDGPDNDALREEWSVLGWDDDKRLPNEDMPDHASDAVSYALRRLRHYSDQANEPVDNSPEAVAKRQEDEWISRRLGNTNRSYQRAQQLRAAAQRR